MTKTPNYKPNSLVDKVKELEESLEAYVKSIEVLKKDIKDFEKKVKALNETVAKKDLCIKKIGQNCVGWGLRAERYKDSEHKSIEYLYGDLAVLKSYADEGLRLVKEGLK